MIGFHIPYFSIRSEALFVSNDNILDMQNSTYARVTEIELKRRLCADVHGPAG